MAEEMIPSLTLDLLCACTGSNSDRAGPYLDGFRNAMPLYQINTPKRIAMFLANVGHESMNLRYRVELWGPTLAQDRYEGRQDLGNYMPDDGYNYRGRGWLQTTGRKNYRLLTERLRKRWPQMEVPDFEATPDALARSEWAAISACDYVGMRNLNSFADKDDFDGYCDVINLGHKTVKHGDSNGFIDRQSLYSRALPKLLAAVLN